MSKLKQLFRWVTELPHKDKLIFGLFLLVAFGYSHQANAGVLSWIFGSITSWTFGNVVTLIGGVIIWLLGWMVVIAGTIFDIAIKQSILTFGELAEMEALRTAWTIFRDLSNMTFIFVIMYIAVATILDLGGVNIGKMLITIAVTALMVNFSFAFTRVVIDLSNVAAAEFYNKTLEGGSSTGLLRGNNQYGGGWSGGQLANVFVGALNINQMLTGPKETDELPATLGGSIMSILGAICLILAVTSVLLAGAVLMAIRSITLYLLIMFSPLAFVSFAIPGMSGQGSKWWGKLLNQCFFAPAFMLMLYVTARYLNDTTMVNSMSGGKPENIVGALFGGSAKVIFYYGTAIILMVASILVAQQMGAEGVGIAKSTAAWGTKKLASGFGGAIRKTGKWADTKTGGFVSSRAASISTAVDKQWSKLEGNAILGDLAKAGRSAADTVTDYASSPIKSAAELTDVIASGAGGVSGLMPKLTGDDAKIEESSNKLETLETERTSWQTKKEDAERRLAAGDATAQADIDAAKGELDRIGDEANDILDGHSKDQWAKFSDKALGSRLVAGRLEGKDLEKMPEGKRKKALEAAIAAKNDKPEMIKQILRHYKDDSVSGNTGARRDYIEKLLEDNAIAGRSVEDQAKVLGSMGRFLGNSGINPALFTGSEFVNKLSPNGLIALAKGMGTHLGAPAKQAIGQKIYDTLHTTPKARWSDKDKQLLKYLSENAAANTEWSGGDPTLMTNIQGLWRTP